MTVSNQLFCEVFDIVRRNVIHEKDRDGTQKTDIANIITDLRDLGYQEDLGSIPYPKEGSALSWIDEDGNRRAHFFIDGTIRLGTILEMGKVGKQYQNSTLVHISLASSRCAGFKRDYLRNKEDLKELDAITVAPFYSKDRIRRAVLGARCIKGAGQTSTI